MVLKVLTLFHILVNLPPFMVLQKVIYEFIFPKHYLILQEKWQCSHYFGIMFLIETMIPDINYMVITMLNGRKGNGNVLII